MREGEKDRAGTKAGRKGTSAGGVEGRAGETSVMGQEGTFMTRTYNRWYNMCYICLIILHEAQYSVSYT